jgi:hypothetical protein
VLASPSDRRFGAFPNNDRSTLSREPRLAGFLFAAAWAFVVLVRLSSLDLSRRDGAPTHHHRDRGAASGGQGQLLECNRPRGKFYTFENLAKLCAVSGQKQNKMPKK